MSLRYRNWHGIVTVTDLHQMRERWARSEAEPATVEAPTRVPEELPLMQQLAILQMMHSTLARGVAKRLQSINDCQDRPGRFDYGALVAAGLAYREHGDRWHTLTPEGWIFARAMLKRLCAENGIHLLQEKAGAHAVYFHCSCGQWSTVLNGKPGMHLHRRAMNRFYAHVPAHMKRAESA